MTWRRGDVAAAVNFVGVGGGFASGVTNRRMAQRVKTRIRVDEVVDS